MTQKKLTIGKISKISNTGIETIRNYERLGLLPKPERTASGYRLYSEIAIQRLHFINQSKSLGFSLTEIGELLSLSTSSDASCGDVRALTQTKIDDINQRISKLSKMKKALETLMSQCHESSPIAECPILTALEGEKS